MGLLSTIFGWCLNEISSSVANKRNKKNTKDFMALENNYYRQNLDLQNKINQDNYNNYESPDAKRKQLVQAGFNPVLAGANLNGTIGSVAASAPHQSAPQSSPAPVAPFELASDFMTLKSMKLDIQRKKLENEKLKEDIKSTAITTEKTKSDIEFSNLSNPITLALLSNEVDNKELENKLKSLQINSVDSSLQKQILEDTLSIYKISEEMSYYNDNPTLYRTQLETQTNLLIAELNKANLSNKLTQSQIAKTNAELQRILIDNHITKQDREEYEKWYLGLSPELRTQLQDARNNLLTYNGGVYSKDQINIMMMQQMQNAQLDKLKSDNLREWIQLPFHVAGSVIGLVKK